MTTANPPRPINAPAVLVEAIQAYGLQVPGSSGGVQEMAVGEHPTVMALQTTSGHVAVLQAVPVDDQGGLQLEPMVRHLAAQAPLGAAPRRLMEGHQDEIGSATRRKQRGRLMSGEQLIVGANPPW